MDRPRLSGHKGRSESPRPRASRSATGRRGAKKGVLTKEASDVRLAIESRKKIFEDDRLFFVVRFVGPTNSRPSRSALDSLGGTITQAYDDSAKIAIMPAGYGQFVDALEKKRASIVVVRGPDPQDKIEQKLLSVLQSGSGPQDVTIEAVDLSGLDYADALASALDRYAREAGGRAKLAYSADNFAVFSARLPSEAIMEIAERVDIVESIEAMPTIRLTAL